jgi:hypothetical protein
MKKYTRSLFFFALCSSFSYALNDSTSSQIDTNSTSTLVDTLKNSTPSAMDTLALKTADTNTTQKKIIPWRIAAVTATAASSLGSAYIFILANGWYKDNNNHFHLDPPRNDFYYAGNHDKWGHAFGGYLASNLFSDAFSWAGMSDKSSWISGAIAGSAIQYAIEYKDGYAPDWGFSLWDPLAGSAGSIFASAQRFYPSLQAIDFKMSYYRNTNIYQNANPQDPFWNDDYQNQTYWLSFKMHKILPSMRNWWPKWISPAIGVSMSDDRLAFENVDTEYFVSLDWDLTEIFKPKNPYLKRFVYYANLAKWPSPSYLIYPTRRIGWHWAYPIQF